MKTDDRMADKISHLESDIKILKNEVQAVLIDLRDKYQEANNPFNTPSAPVAPQQIPVEQKPAANEAKSDTVLRSGSVEKEGGNKTQEPARLAQAGKETHPETVKKEAKDKTQEQTITLEAGKETHQETIRKDVNDKIQGSEAGRGTHPKTAREEVIQAQIPEEVLKNIRDVNLISIVGLVNWADESIKKLGQQKTEAILDVAEMMGLLSPQLKHIMTKLINIDNDSNSQSVSARVLLDSLVKITTLLGKDNQIEAALLSILSEEDDHG